MSSARSSESMRASARLAGNLVILEYDSLVTMRPIWSRELLARLRRLEERGELSPCRVLEEMLASLKSGRAKTWAAAWHATLGCRRRG